MLTLVLRTDFPGFGDGSISDDDYAVIAARVMVRVGWEKPLHQSQLACISLIMIRYARWTMETRCGQIAWGTVWVWDRWLVTSVCAGTSSFDFPADLPLTTQLCRACKRRLS